MNNKVRRLKDGTYEWSNDGGETWEQCTPEEFDEYLAAGAEDLTDLDEAEETSLTHIDCEVPVSEEDSIISLDLTDGGLEFKFKKQEGEVYPTFADELYFTWFKDAVARNSLDMALKVYDMIVNAKMRDGSSNEDENNGHKVTNEAEEIEFSAETDLDAQHDDENGEGSLSLNTVKDVYNYASNKENKLDSTFVSAVASSEGNLETLGGQSFRIHEVQLPLEDPEKDVYCRFLVGVLDGQDDGIFVCIPNTWQTVASLEEVDYDQVNEDTPCNAIVSESLVIEDPDNFYKELGDLYASGPAFMPKSDVELPAGEEEETSFEEEPAAEEVPPEGEPAEITDIESSDEISFESDMSYLPKSSEAWLKEFTASENFITKGKAYLKSLTEALRPSLRKHIIAMLSEDKNFIAVRVDKSGIMESSLTTAWFKKRLTKICEAIKKTGTDLRMVETRGSYYTRTFFLVEATNKNYCISEDELLEEISIKGSDILLETKKATLTEEALAKLNELLNNDDHIVIKPTLKDKNGTVIESIDVDNDDKRPYIIRVNEDAPKIVLVPQELVPVYLEPGATLDVMTADGETVTIAQAEGTPAPVEEPTPVADPATVAVEEPLNDVTQAADIASKEASLGDNGLIRVKPEELEETLLKLFDDRCVPEADFINGFQTRCFPIEIDLGDAGCKKLLVCDLYGNKCQVEPCGTDGGAIVTDLKGKPLYYGDELNTFLSNLLSKYL